MFARRTACRFWQQTKQQTRYLNGQASQLNGHPASNNEPHERLMNISHKVVLGQSFPSAEDMRFSVDFVSSMGQQVRKSKQDYVAALRFQRCVSAFEHWLVPCVNKADVVFDDAAEVRQFKPDRATLPDHLALMYYPDPDVYNNTLSAFTHPELADEQAEGGPTVELTEVSSEHLLRLIEEAAPNELECFSFNPVVTASGSYFSFDTDHLESFTRWRDILQTEKALLEVKETKSRAALTNLWEQTASAWVLTDESGKVTCHTDDGDAVYAFVAPDVASSFNMLKKAQGEGNWRVSEIKRLEALALSCQHNRVGLRFVYSESSPARFEQFQINKW